MACKAELEFPFQLIDNELALEDAMKELKQQTLLAVDCEGISLSRTGELTVLSIATREKAYIFDVLAANQAIFSKASGLREILESKSQEKLMFDCREDSDALSHQFKIKLAGVLDLQLLEVMYRRENTASKTPPVKPSSKRNQRRSQKTDEVESIYGYRRCMELYLDDEDSMNVKDKGTRLLKTASNVWKKRPLSNTLIQYCVVDTMGLFKLYDKIKDILSGREKMRLQMASERYADFYRSRETRSFDDYEKNAYLPLDVIPDKGTPHFPLATTSCVRYHRQFPLEEFSNTQLRNGEQKCRVCKKIKQRHDEEEERERRYADDDCIAFSECENDYCFTWGCNCDSC